MIKQTSFLQKVTSQKPGFFGVKGLNLNLNPFGGDPFLDPEGQPDPFEQKIVLKFSGLMTRIKTCFGF